MYKIELSTVLVLFGNLCVAPVDFQHNIWICDSIILFRERNLSFLIIQHKHEKHNLFCIFCLGELGNKLDILFKDSTVKKSYYVVL